MNVACAIPLQIPVHRVRASVRCRELGTPLHTTIRRLADVTADEELIAAATGLSLAGVARVRGELAHELAPIEREYLVWVDHARGRCLPYTALDGVVAPRRKDGGLTLPLDPPTPASLARMGLSAAASWDGGIDGHVEIAEVLDVVADARGGAPSGTGSLPHVLRLPDTHLLVYFENDRPYQPRVALTQHAIDDLELTRWLHEHYGPSLTSEILDLSDITEARALPPAWLADLIGQSKPDGEGRPWELVDPHPYRVRQAVGEVVEAATDRLDVCAPSVRELPEWLRHALAGARERDVSVVIRPAQSEDPPRRADALLAVLPGQPQALCVIADTEHAAIHTDPMACLDRGEARAPRPQHLALTHAKAAVGALLELLGLAPPKQRKPSERLDAQAVRGMLVQALSKLEEEIPAGVHAEIEPDDERAAAATLDRYHARGGSPTEGMHTAAAGIAWERIVIATATDLCERHDQLAYLAARWSPPQGGIDLDVILTDHAKRLVWVIDAKNAKPASEQEGKMIHQLRVLRNDSQMIPDGWRAMGIIVHPPQQLRTSPHQTEQRSILRATLQDLPRVLLTDALPDQRVR
ncbi:MAG TPA: hypothetical protein VK790_10195 [Solirubrobacteraceae bacterium]|jgi:hypothetical protein|nr:hypothetical protein [Solirubrobacteraceae bacterium]